MSKHPKLLYVVNEAYFFVSHRLAVARGAVAAGFLRRLKQLVERPAGLFK